MGVSHLIKAIAKGFNMDYSTHNNSRPRLLLLVWAALMIGPPFHFKDGAELVYEHVLTD